jgi:cytochrome c556
MNRHAAGFWAAGVLALALIPLMWAMSIAGLGSMAAASTVADTVMVWILSWGIVVVASLAAVMVAWICFSNAVHEMRATRHRKQPVFQRLVLVFAVFLLSGLVVQGQTAATGQAMRAKLTHAQKILEAILTSNYGLLEVESNALARVTQSPAWTVLNSPEYRRQSDAFLAVTRNLVDAAKQRDLDAAAMHYSSLTMSCYQCHRYMKNARIAR